MFGILFAAIASCFDEIGTSIGKNKINTREQSVYTMGFLQNVSTFAIFAMIALAKPGIFVFSAASLPTFLIRAILEVLQVHLTVHAIARTDRSTYGFIRVLTIPLLLGSDIALGYAISLPQYVGISCMVAALFIIFMNHGINKQAAGFVLAIAINAAITLSLYKFNISHFNSVAGEQLPIYGILLLYLFCAARITAKENPFRMWRNSASLTQIGATGISGILGSFAFNLAPASIILAASRSSAVLWSVLSGRVYFKEKSILIKLLTSALLLSGLILLLA